MISFTRLHIEKNVFTHMEVEGYTLVLFIFKLDSSSDSQILSRQYLALTPTQTTHNYSKLDWTFNKYLPLGGRKVRWRGYWT